MKVWIRGWTGRGYSQWVEKNGSSLNKSLQPVEGGREEGTVSVEISSSLDERLAGRGYRGGEKRVVRVETLHSS